MAPFENPFKKSAKKEKPESRPSRDSFEEFIDPFEDNYFDDDDFFDDIFDEDLNEGFGAPIRDSGREAPETPEALDNIQFRLVRDRDGELIGYKSSGYGRKEVRLAPSAQESILFNLDTNREYRVRVVGDTDPENPLKGSYLVELVRPSRESDRYELEHRGAQVARARRLAGSDGFKVLASMINGDPDLSAEFRPVVSRHKEYRGLHRDKEERHRNFTGMLSGLMMSERGNKLLNKIIDRTVTRESGQMKEFIRDSEQPPYVPSILLGAGVHGAIMATARQMQLPEVPDLTIEQSSRIGGQFAQYGTDLFRLNSRRRPERPDEPHLPGTSQSLNSAGNHAVMHSSDTGMESYPYQSTISDTARANFLLAGKVIVNAKVEKIRPNPEGRGEGKFIVEFVDNDSEEVFEVATDRVTFTTGIGEEIDRLDPFDPATRQILAEEKEKFKKGEDARVLSLSEFGTRMTDTTNPFPLKGMKRLVLSGKGDSAAIIAGIVLGYESQVGKTSSQLDSVEQILWIGQDLVSKEEFLENCRARYAQIGLEFPRDKFEKYYHRITPLSGVRSSRLQRAEDGRMRVLLESSFDGTERNPTTADPNSRFRRDELRESSDEFRRSGVEGDYFIYAHGFEDQTDKIVAPIEREFIPRFSEDDYERIIEDIRNVPSVGEAIYFKKGPIRYVEILETSFDDQGKLVSLRTLTSENKYVFETIPVGEFRQRQAYFQTSNIDYAERNSYLSPDFDTEFGQVRGERRAIGRVYTYRNGGEVYKAGPVANLPLDLTEGESTPALRSIKENTASIFRYVDLVETLAERLADADKKGKVERPELFNSTAGPSRAEVTADTVQYNNTVSVDLDAAQLDKIGLADNSLDMLKLGIGDRLSKYKFEPDDELTLTVVKEKSDATRVAFEVSSELAYAYGIDLEIVENVIRDPLVAGVLNKMTSNIRSGGIVLTIPIDERGRVVPAEISYKATRGS